MKRGEQPLTQEQLQLGFRQLRRPGWPATLEEALRCPVRSGCIHGMARHLSRAQFNAGQHRPPTLPGAPPVPPTPSQPPMRKQAAGLQAPALRLKPGRKPGSGKPAVDLKRAAANDRDDD